MAAAVPGTRATLACRPRVSVVAHTLAALTMAVARVGALGWKVGDAIGIRKVGPCRACGACLFGAVCCNPVKRRIANANLLRVHTAHSVERAGAVVDAAVEHAKKAATAPRARRNTAE